MSLFLEPIFIELKKKKSLNHPNPHTFNVNGVTTWLDKATQTHLFWCGQDYTGLAYKEFIEGAANVFPYYNGVVLTEVELHSWTNLHKAKTEEALMESLYRNSWETHKECSNILLSEGVLGSFEDYVIRLRRVFHCIRWFNSTQVV